MIRCRDFNPGWDTLTALCLFSLSTDSIAQVALDGKFGTAGGLTGPNYNITAEMGAVRGNNLFHSFQQFDLNAGDVAAFSGPAGIQNILTRVTGGSPSSIDGTIRSDIAGANFFLINPHGVILGPNARVDVSGAFAFSTADYLKLADGARFVAALDAEDSALSTAPVSAFGFLGPIPGGIEVQGSALEAGSGHGISLVGGDITLAGSTVQSAGGQIQAVSVKSSGEVPVDPAASTSGEFLSTFPEKGSVTLRDQAKIDASGEGGGRIVIRGGSLLVDNSKIESNTTGATDGQGIEIAFSGAVNISNGGQINSLSTLGFAGSGNITVQADTVRLDGGGLIDDFFNPITQISTATGELFFGGGPGKGGEISILTRHLELYNSAQISSATFGAGDAGRIAIEAETVRMDALGFTPTQITANSQQTDGGGKAGDISIKTDLLEMRNAATMLAASFGSGGGGVVDIEAETVNLFSSAIITAATFGPGSGGDVRVKAGSIRLDGADEFGGPDQLTGIQAITSDPLSPAPGGNIQITADAMEMDHNGRIFTTSFGAGKGGDIEIHAGKLTMANGSTLGAEGQADGSAGTLSIRSDGDILLTGGSAIATSAPGSSGGDITVSAGSEIRLVDSEFNAQAGLNGGNISVSAPDLVYLLNGTLTAQADTTGTGFGNGGNLTIQPSSFFILNDGALISKSSFGNGGNILILTDYFFESGSIIDATAPFGLPGTVQVTAPEVDLSGVLVALPGNLLDAESLLRPDCAVRLSDNLSSFILLGRGGLPLQPGGFLPSGMVPQRENAP